MVAMSRKIIYVSFMRLTDRVSRDWYIDYLIAKGVNVEYWDIISLVREEHNEAGMKTPAYLHIFRTFSEVEAILRLPESRDAWYVMLVSHGGRFTRIFRLLSKHNCRMVFLAVGALPVIVKPRWWKILDHLCHPLRLSKLMFDMPKVYVLRKLNLIRPFDIMFAAGQVLMAHERYATKIIPINTCDYDHYVRVRSQEGRLVRGRYVVFLDTNLAYHSDLKINNMLAVNPVTYHQALNRFFELLEIEYEIKVVIAAHPTSNYGDETFQGRDVYRLKTAELARDADFVITHHSTSIGYAVLNLKPLMFIYTNEMLSLYEETVMRTMRAMSSYLGSAIYNIDKITRGKQIIIKDVNVNRYENYKYDFLTTHESEHTTSQEMLWRELSAV